MSYSPFAQLLNIEHNDVSAKLFTIIADVIGVSTPGLNVTSLASIIETFRTTKNVAFTGFNGVEKVEVSRNGITACYRLPNLNIPNSTASILVTTNSDAPGFKHITDELDRIELLLPRITNVYSVAA